MKACLEYWYDSSNNIVEIGSIMPMFLNEKASRKNKQKQQFYGSHFDFQSFELWNLWILLHLVLFEQ